MMVLLLALVAGLGLGVAQDTKLTAGPGCADLPPAPPADLRALAGDSSVLLTWNRPSNGACVSVYEVRVVQMDATKRTFLPPQSTPEFSLNVSQLTNGATYKFFVKAFAAKYNAGGEAQVVATPTAACAPSLLPSPPTNLTARPGNSNVTLCFGPPANNACVDEYRVAVRVAVPEGAQRSAGGSTMYRRFNKGGCVAIANLTNGVAYELSVQAYSAPLKGGAFASVRATPLPPPKPWTCIPAAGFYPLCSAAAAGLCSPLNCAQQASKCGAPFMRVVDAASRTVVQYCAEVCGCSADPATGAAASRPSAAARDAAADSPPAQPQPQPQPRVQAFDGTNGEPATRATAETNWQSPQGCCTGPVRTRSAFGGGDGEAGEGGGAAGDEF